MMQVLEPRAARTSGEHEDEYEHEHERRSIGRADVGKDESGSMGLLVKLATVN